MMWRNRKLRWLPVLALGIALCGCAEWPLRNKPQPARSTAPPVPLPPEPAAALYIPTPPRALTPDEVMIAQVSGQSPAPQPEAPPTEALPALVPVNATEVVNSVPATDERGKLRELHARAAQQIAHMNSYIMRLKRR
jgi:hypothetical protein